MSNGWTVVDDVFEEPAPRPKPVVFRWDVGHSCLSMIPNAMGVRETLLYVARERFQFLDRIPGLRKQMGVAP